MSVDQSFYDILKITPKTSDEDVKRAYRTLVKTYHPDFNPQNRRLAELKLKALNEAYAHLKTREGRIAYNQSLRLEGENDNSLKNTSILSHIGNLIWPSRNTTSAGK